MTRPFIKHYISFSHAVDGRSCFEALLLLSSVPGEHWVLLLVVISKDFAAAQAAVTEVEFMRDTLTFEVTFSFLGSTWHAKAQGYCPVLTRIMGRQVARPCGKSASVCFNM
jgi:hypothetical protein